MLIKPIVDQLKNQEYFWENKASKNIPALDDLHKINPNERTVTLPICYFLPLKDGGAPIRSKGQPSQSITSMYSFCIIAEAADVNTLDEPPISEAKQKLLEALLGFAISPLYEPMEFISGQYHESNSKYESWVLNFEATRTFRKQR